MSESDPQEIRRGGLLYRRLLRYAQQYYLAFVVAVIAMAVSAGSYPAFAWLMQPLIDGSFGQKDPLWIMLVPVLIILVFIVRGVAEFASTYVMNWIGRRIVKQLRWEMFEKLLHLPTRFFDRSTTGHLISKLTFDVEQVANAATRSVTVLIKDSLTVLFLLGLMLYNNWILALVFMVVGPILALLVLYVNRRFRLISMRIQASMGDVTQVSQEVIDGHRVVKAFGGKEYERERFEPINERNRRQHMKLISTGAVSTSVIQLITAAALSGIVFLATTPAMLEHITPGIFMSFMMAMMMLLTPIKSLTMVNASIQQGIAAANSVFGLIDAHPERDTGVKVIERARGHVEYRDVVFEYDRSKGRVIEHVSFEIQPGQTVAFVGASGSGKSTLMSLLLRYYDLDSGAILLDGQDIRDLTLDCLRRQLAFVSQDVVLFNDTIANNIAYGGRKQAGPRAIEEAAAAAHALEFIRELPQGFETMIGEHGVLLSGGQRQRLAIARALLKDAPVLILDEATSALDSESEGYIQDALKTLMRNRTTLVIAHRLSTIEHADKIIVMRNGTIVEEGKHEALLQQKSYYARLYQLQFGRHGGAAGKPSADRHEHFG